jgi:hypothetical protein
LIFTNFLLVPNIDMDIFCQFTIFSEFCPKIENMFETKTTENSILLQKKLFLSSKNFFKYFLSDKNQVVSSNFIKKIIYNLKK